MKCVKCCKNDQKLFLDAVIFLLLVVVGIWSMNCITVADVGIYSWKFSLQLTVLGRIFSARSFIVGLLRNRLGAWRMKIQLTRRGYLHCVAASYFHVQVRTQVVEWMPHTCILFVYYSCIYIENNYFILFLLFHYLACSTSLPYVNSWSCGWEAPGQPSFIKFGIRGELPKF